jgi:hypothetical protein
MKGTIIRNYVICLIKLDFPTADINFFNRELIRYNSREARYIMQPSNCHLGLHLSRKVVSQYVIKITLGKKKQSRRN